MVVSMGFTFAARTLLELGKELISSDDVALYELIKNAFDAQVGLLGEPQRIRVLVQVILTRSRVNTAQQMLEDGKSYSSVCDYLISSVLPSAPADASARFIDALKKAAESGNEFEKKMLEAYEKENWLKVIDRGHGMTLTDLRDIFLRIGTRSRRSANENGARYLGDKGVGRLSAMRLGDRLTVKTTTANSSHWNILDIDWTIFTHENDRDASDVNIVPIIGPRKEDQTEQGTTIVVSGLNTEWDPARFADLLEGRVARMIDPFVPGLANRLIEISYNGRKTLIESIDKLLLDGAHAVLSLKFTAKEGLHLKGEVNYKLRNGSVNIDLREAEIMSVVQEEAGVRGKKGKAATRLLPLTSAALNRLGDFEAQIYWYNRGIIEGIDGLTQKKQESRDKIAKWSGGPMLYRHGFRILPYGDPDDDWLGLDTAAFGTSGFKLNRQQVIGRVSVSASHEYLSEQTNREGLLRSDAADALTRILKWAIHSEMRGLINRLDKTEQLNKRLALEQADHLAKSRDRIVLTLERLENVLNGREEELVQQLVKQVDALTMDARELHDRLDRVLKEAASEREKFVYMAGVGLMTELVFHEMHRTVEFTLAELNRNRQNDSESLVRSLNQQLTTLSKRVAAFDELTGAKRQVKSDVEIIDVVRDAVDAHSNEFSRHNINVKIVKSSHFDAWKVKAVKGMLIQIVENLISNAVYWLKHQEQYEENFNPYLTITLDKMQRRLSISDNGPGVDIDRSELIFEPFVTTKPPNRGRGLGLYISRELAEYHGWSIFLDRNATEIRAGRSNTFTMIFGASNDD